MLYDLVIRHATLISGDGSRRFEADVAVAGDRIAAIGALGDARGAQEIDATGKIVAPGFIDVHTHDDGALLAPHGMDPKISQGVTTVIAGNCGISLAPLLLDSAPPPPFTLVGGQENFRFDRFADYVAELRQHGIATNAALLVGHTTLRQRVMPVTDRAANEEETALMQEAVARAMAEGAFGLSTGLDYPPAVKSSTAEVKALAATAASLGGPYVTHTRNYFETMDEAIDEAIDIADHAGGKLFISHHQSTGRANFGKSGPSLKRTASARKTMDIGMDVYPLCRKLHCFAAGALRHRTEGPHHLVHAAPRDGQSRNCRHRRRMELQRTRGRPAAVAGGRRLFPARRERRAHHLAHPRSMVGSDGLPHDIHPHPRLWGTFPRVLGHYARDVGLFSLKRPCIA